VHWCSDTARENSKTRRKTCPSVTLSCLGQCGRCSDLLRAGRSGDRMPMGSRFSAPVQTATGVRPASCTMGAGLFPGVKRLGCAVDHPPPRCTSNPAPGLHGLFLGCILSILLQPLCIRRLSRLNCGTAQNQHHILLEALTVAQLIKNFPAIYSTRTHVHCCAHKTPPMVPIRSQMNSAHTVPPYFF